MIFSIFKSTYRVLLEYKSLKIESWTDTFLITQGAFLSSLFPTIFFTLITTPLSEKESYTLCMSNTFFLNVMPYLDIYKSNLPFPSLSPKSLYLWLTISIGQCSLTILLSQEEKDCFVFQLFQLDLYQI